MAETQKQIRKKKNILILIFFPQRETKPNMWAKINHTKFVYSLAETGFQSISAKTEENDLVFFCSQRCFASMEGSEGLWDAASVYISSDLVSCSNQTNSTNSSTVGGIVLFPYYQHSLPTAALFTLAYLFIFLLCLMGNGLVCVIVLRNRHMRTVTNIFILNLAVSDLLVGIFCIPTTLVDNLITGVEI